MNLIAICIAFIVSIVSVGTPLFFHVISKFDEKYHSEKIIELFKRESGFNFLRFLLIISPIAILLYIINSYLLAYTNNEILRRCLLPVSIFLLFITILLLIQFIYFSFKVLKYSIPSSFIKGRIKSLGKTRKIESNDHLSGAINFFLYSIQKELTDVCSLMPDYMFQVFTNYREKYNDEFIKFPDIYYGTTYLIAQELALQNSHRLKNLGYYASGFNWLVGSVEDSKISTETYKCLWFNLRLLIENDKEDMVSKYWEQAFRHIQNNLRIPGSIYKSLQSREKLNQDEIDKIEEERKEFIEFHYYLGGLLLYENRIECIRKNWDYTTSEPPRYPLLPYAMGEIFKRYFDLCQVFDRNSWEKAARFNFPRIDSVNFDWIVNKWVRKYLILLFLRQYTLQHYYTYDNFLELPNPPESQAEKKHWIDNIQRFTDELKEIIRDTELLKSLRFDTINDECKKEGKTPPVDLVETLKNHLEEEFGKGREQQSISEQKEKTFWESSKRIIQETFEEYEKLINKEKINDSYKSFSIDGDAIIVSKSDFADEQEYDHLNYDSFVAEGLSNKIQRRISETFSSVLTQSYLFKDEDLFAAIDNLKISEKPDEFIIISFRVNINYFMNVLKIKDLKSDEYKKIQLINIWNCNDYLVGGTFFIFRKSDLPNLLLHEPATKIKEDYKAEELILDKIYASILNLHQQEEIRNRLEEKLHRNDLNDKVCVSIEMNAEIRWRKDTKVIALRAASSYEDRGVPNKLEEVKPFDKI